MLPRATAAAAGSMSSGLYLTSCCGQKTPALNLQAFCRARGESHSGASWAHHLVTCWDAQSHQAELKQKGKQENLTSASHPASNAQMFITASVSLRFPCPHSDLFEFCQKAQSYCRRGIIHNQKQLAPP